MLKTHTLAPKEERPSFRLTARDVEILKAVHDYRALTTEQIKALFFAHSLSSGTVNSRCRLRVRDLYHHGSLLR